MRDQLATELAEEREARLQQMRDRLAAKSVEEREARLQQMSTRQRERLATESAEEREARLQQMRDRLATESAEEREARLQQMRDRLASPPVCALLPIRLTRVGGEVLCNYFGAGDYKNYRELLPNRSKPNSGLLDRDYAHAIRLPSCTVSLGPRPKQETKAYTLLKPCRDCTIYRDGLCLQIARVL